jgi:hypothetical protein
MTGKPIGQLGAVAPLARAGPKLRPELWWLARIVGKAFHLGSFVPVVLGGLHMAVPRV